MAGGLSPRWCMSEGKATWPILGRFYWTIWLVVNSTAPRNRPGLPRAFLSELPDLIRINQRVLKSRMVGRPPPLYPSLASPGEKPRLGFTIPSARQLGLGGPPSSYSSSKSGGNPGPFDGWLLNIRGHLGELKISSCPGVRLWFWGWMEKTSSFGLIIKKIWRFPNNFSPPILWYDFHFNFFVFETLNLPPFGPNGNRRSKGGLEGGKNTRVMGKLFFL